MFCSKCGVFLREGSNFCWNCGAAVCHSFASEAKNNLQKNHNTKNERAPWLNHLIWFSTWFIVLILVLLLMVLIDSLLGFILCFIAGIVALIVYCVKHGLKCQRERENKTLASEDVQSMTGLEYEHWCAKRMAGSGKYRKVTVTPPTGDFGADIVAVDAAKRTWVIQCKHYHSKLGNSPIQEVVSAKAHYGAECAAVVTNSTFTEKARQLAKENKVKLYEHVDGNTLHKKKWRNYSAEEMMFYDDIFN
ncbi:MAG: restriction endonuclease [Clostridiales bacterium]|nr:restriction endonuclease [Clostridiales bacterium]